MGNLIRKAKTSIRCRKTNTANRQTINDSLKKDTTVFTQVSTEELKERRVDLYPYLI